MISVVIPLYNKENLVEATLRSVLAQTCGDFEIVVVDDGSTDRSREVVESFSDSRIRLVQKENGGVASARNRGIEESRSEYIALFDADDIMEPEYLSELSSLALRYPQADVYAVRYGFRNMAGDFRPMVLNKIRFQGEDGILDNYFEVASCSTPPICSSSVMIRKQALETIGGFPTGIKSGEDLLTWARLAVRYKIAYSMKTLAYFIRDVEHFNADQKQRRPSGHDIVGKELARLYNDNPTVSGLRDYVALWHKMRARIFLTKNERRNSVRECCKSLSYSFNPKILVFLAMNIMPYKVNKYLFSRLG